jgi:hypothetical protein
MAKEIMNAFDALEKSLIQKNLPTRAAIERVASKIESAVDYGETGITIDNGFPLDADSYKMIKHLESKGYDVSRGDNRCEYEVKWNKAVRPIKESNQSISKGEEPANE